MHTLFKIVFAVLSFIFIASSELKIDYQHPFPAGISFNDVAAVNDSVAILIGDYGTILRTEDKGESWSPIETNTRTKIRKIHFSDERHGIIGCDNGILMKTSDGGISWETQQVDTSGIRDIFLLDSMHCWLHTIDYKTFKTSDGGASWQLIRPKWSEYHYVGSPMLAKYIDPLTGYRACFTSVAEDEWGALYKTTDGGVIWENLSNDQEYVGTADEFFVFDSLKCIVKTSGIIMASGAGGKNWEETFIADSGSGGDLHMFDSLNGWICLSRSVIHKTNTGPYGWKRYPFTSDIITTLYPEHLPDFRSIDFYNKSHGYMVGSLVLKFTNSGEDLEEINNQVTNNTLYSVAIQDSSVVCVVGYKGEILRTENGGKDWSLIKSRSIREDSAMTSIKCIAENEFVASGWSGKIIKSTDAGLTWSSVNSNTNNPLNDIEFPTSEIGYAVGNSGTILKSTDGGSSWNDISYSSDSAFFYAASFPTEDTGYVLDGKSVFKTVDGGNTWDPTSLSSGDIMVDISFPTALKGFAVGDNRGILITEDGGLTWEKADIPYAINVFTKVIAINIDTVYVIGQLANLYKTTDGGKNWKEWSYNIHAANDLWGLDFYNGSHGWLVGSNGGIFKVSDTDSGTVENVNDPTTFTDLPLKINIKQHGKVLKIRLGEDGFKNPSIRVYDFKGRNVIKENLCQINSKFEVTIPISSLAKGIYMISIKNKSLKVFRHVIIR